MATVDGLAFDRASVSVRSKDADGRLHIEFSPISKANVCGYLGREIPDAEGLGLKPDRLYQLYRDPDELAKGAATFNKIPILNRHIPVSAAAPQKEAIIGATGSDAEFAAPYLKNSLVVWDSAAIDLIESGEQKEISSAYRYAPDMTPGVSPGGERFDGVMRSIRANHVAIVPKGRAGPDVVVGDAALPILTTQKETRRMATKKILSPKAAAAKSALTAHLSALIAQDAELEDVIKLLETLEPDPEAKDDPAEITEDDGAEAQIKAICGGKIPDEDIARIIAMVTPALGDEVVSLGNEVVSDGKDAEAKPEDKKDEGKDGEEKVTKTAMDAAIAAAVKVAEDNTVARLKGARDAERAVEPWVGKLVAMDSADAVYGAALKTLGIDTKGVHPSAYPHILKAQPLPGSRAQTPRMAADAATSSADFSKRFPGAATVRHV